MNTYHAVSVSGGKDSTAMVIEMVERGLPIDCAVCADTGMEFPEMYEHLARLDDFLYRERGLHITILQSQYSFEYYMFEKPVQRSEEWKHIPPYGYGWPGLRQRWCTGQMKTHLLNKHINGLKEDKQVLHYVGIAADEPKRIKGEKYPLVEWNITEAEALQICYRHGFDWGGLYEIYHRCSCWCCPFQRIGELRKLRKNHPELWQRLQGMDARAREQFGPGPLGQFKTDWSVERLEARFAAEDMQICIPGGGP